jgi:hypothetical protein
MNFLNLRDLRRLREKRRRRPEIWKLCRSGTPKTPIYPRISLKCSVKSTESRLVFRFEFLLPYWSILTTILSFIVLLTSLYVTVFVVSCLSYLVGF